MQDGVRNTHCTAPSKKKKKKPRPCKQTQPQLHPGAQIIHRLFWNCLLWHAEAAFPETVKNSTFQHQTKARGDGTDRRREGKAGRVHLKKNKAGSDSVPPECHCRSSRYLMICDQFSNETNNSSQPEDGLSSTITGSQDKLTKFPLMSRSSFSSLPQNVANSADYQRERVRQQGDRHRRVYVRMHACSGIRDAEPQTVMWADKHNFMPLRRSMQPTSTYKYNGLSTQSVPAVLWAVYRLSDALNNRIKPRHRCEPVQSRNPQQTSWSNTPDRQTESVCSQRERRRGRRMKKTSLLSTISWHPSVTVTYGRVHLQVH